MSKQNKTVLVTGAGGFVGSHLVEFLSNYPDFRINAMVWDKDPINNLNSSSYDLSNVTQMVGDVRDERFVEECVQGCDWVFHLASQQNDINATDDDFFTTNVLGTRNVMRACLKFGVKRVLHVSSLAAIKTDSSRVNENSVQQGFFDGAYSRTKFLGEKMAFEYCAKGVPVVVVNPTIIYGSRARVLCTYVKLHVDSHIRFYSFPNMVMNMVHVSDAVDFMFRAIQDCSVGERYLLGGREITMKQYLDLLDKTCKVNKPLIRLPVGLLEMGSAILTPIWRLAGKTFPVLKPQIDAMKRGSAADCTKLWGVVGKPKVSLRYGLVETINWCRSAGILKN